MPAEPQRSTFSTSPPAASIRKRARCQGGNFRGARDEGCTIFLTSHALADVDELCDRMAVIHRGELRFAGTPTRATQTALGDESEQAFLACIEEPRPSPARDRSPRSILSNLAEYLAPSVSREHTAWTLLPRSNPDILIVGDDPLITDTLISCSAEISASTSRTRARKRRAFCASSETPPELALVDLGLPPTPHRPDEGFPTDQRTAGTVSGHQDTGPVGANAAETNARHAQA